MSTLSGHSRVFLLSRSEKPEVSRQDSLSLTVSKAKEARILLENGVDSRTSVQGLESKALTFNRMARYVILYEGTNPVDLLELLEDGVGVITADALLGFGLPKRDLVVKRMDITLLIKWSCARVLMRSAATRYTTSRQSALARKIIKVSVLEAFSTQKLQALESSITTMRLELSDETGLDRRPCFKLEHPLYECHVGIGR